MIEQGNACTLTVQFTDTNGTALHGNIQNTHGLRPGMV